MRVIKCSIEGFGKILNQEYIFKKELQSFCEENGWGKSTLATFIKVMFFGFADEGKRDELSNERKRYKPWQGGVYGGSLTFETQGKTYIMSRTFGTKSKDDSFLLQDAVTNLPSNDYTDNIGEELFQIDHDSFCRTIYVSQNDCETVSTDSIHAKIGNLAENTNDINQYEIIQKRLTDCLNSMSPGRKTGSIRRRQEQIYELEESVRRIPEIEEAIRLNTEKRDLERERKSELAVMREKLQKELSVISQAKDLQSEKRQYDNLCTQTAKGKEELEQSRLLFKGSVPSPEVLQKMSKNISELSALHTRSASFQFSREEEEKLSALDDLFASGVPEEDEITNLADAWNLRNETKSVLNTKRATLETLREVTLASKIDTTNTVDESSEKTPKPFLLLAGIVVAAAGLALCMVNPTIGSAAAGIGIILAIVGIVSGYSQKKKQADKEKERERKRAVNAERENDKKESGFILLQKEIEEDEKRIIAIEQSMRQMLERYDISCDDREVISRLYKLKGQILEYSNLSAKKQEYDANNVEKEIADLTRILCDFFHEYQPEWSFTMEGAFGMLQELTRRQQSLYECKRVYDSLLESKKRFETEHEIGKLTNLEMVPDGVFDEKTGKLAEITSELEERISHIADYNKRLDEMEQEREDLLEEGEHLKVLQEEMKKEQETYHHLSLTKDYLEKAKESFTAKYREPLQKSFSKYYEMLTRMQSQDYQIDANIHLTHKELGMPRDTRLLSAGLRDLTGLCMRMSLVEAMYEKEKPFLIFDDPFTNLDKEKTDYGLRMMEEISKEYQVLYFTCHESRRLL